MLRDACLGACQSGRSCQVRLPRTRRLHLSLCRRHARERGKKNLQKPVQELIGSLTRKDLLSAKCRRREVVFKFAYSLRLGVSIEEAALQSSSRGVTRRFGRIGFSLFISFRVMRSDSGKSSSRRRPGRAGGRCSSQTPTSFPEREQDRA